MNRRRVGVVLPASLRGLLNENQLALVSGFSVCLRCNATNRFRAVGKIAFF